MSATETKVTPGPWLISGKTKICFPNGAHANTGPDDAWDALVVSDQHGDEICAVYGSINNEPDAKLIARLVSLYFAGKQQAAEREAAIVAAGNVPSDMDYGLTENEIAAGAMLNALAAERDELFEICLAMKDDIDSVFIDPEEMSASWTGIYKRLKDVIDKAESP